MKGLILILLWSTFVGVSYSSETRYHFDRTLLLGYSVTDYTGFRVDISSEKNILVYLITDRESSLNFTKMDTFHYLSEGSCPRKTVHCKEETPSNHILLNDYIYVGVFCDEERPGCVIYDKSRPVNNNWILTKDLIKMVFMTLLLAMAGILPLVISIILVKECNKTRENHTPKFENHYTL